MRMEHTKKEGMWFMATAIPKRLLECALRDDRLKDGELRTLLQLWLLSTRVSASERAANVVRFEQTAIDPKDGSFYAVECTHEQLSMLRLPRISRSQMTRHLKTLTECEYVVYSNMVKVGSRSSLPWIGIWKPVGPRKYGVYILLQPHTVEDAAKR
jgi:hypothetical protein